MSQPSFPGARREHPWHVVIVPTAKGLEGFVWRFAWFALPVWILFFS